MQLSELVRIMHDYHNKQTNDNNDNLSLDKEFEDSEEMVILSLDKKKSYIQ